MKVPSKPVDAARPLCDQRLPKRGSGYGQGVDGVGLAKGSRRVSAVRHQLRRHSHNGFSSSEKVSLEPPGEMAAVLDRPDSRASQALGPLQQCEVIRANGRDTAFAQLATEFVDGDDGVAALVRIDAEYHHVPCLPCGCWVTGPIGGQYISWGGCHAPIKPRRSVLFHPVSRTTGPSRRAKSGGANPPGCGQDDTE
jgi:hypothetical protein